jgi:hypothetical protein
VELTHVELSVAAGTLQPVFEADLDRLLHGVFGWTGETAVEDVPSDGPSTARTYLVTAHVKLVLREQAIGLSPGTQDHLGFRVSNGELDRLVDATIALAAEDARVELRHVERGRALTVEVGSLVFKTFFVRFLVPVWFQFESWDSSPAGTPAPRHPHNRRPESA